MAKLNDYYKKKQIMQQLSEELEKLETDEALKKELAFEKEIKELLEANGKSARDAFEILVAIDPSLRSDDTGGTQKTRAQRPLKTYTNPHTGEVVKTRGGNQKTLIAWRSEYGAEAVQSWAS